jgi:hypothetical protein
MIQLFGFEISRRKNYQDEEQNKSFAAPQNDDGAVTIQSGSYYGTYVNEAIVNDDNGQAVELNTDDLKLPEKIKSKIRDEFEQVLRLLDFGNMGHDIFRRWYIDGRLFYHVVIDEKRPSLGIQELRYIDPRRIRKIREIQKMKDTKTGMEVIKRMQEYYLYNERGMIGAHSNLGTKIAVDSVVNVNSGLLDSKRAMVLSYLHKAIKPLNQLRMVEDATVIYRLSRAPERRVFYVDVGNMPTIKAEQYLRDIMVKYRNKLVYDSSTGEVKDDRKHLSMLEDFWLPRREGTKGTEITTLPGGANLGELEDVKYFERKLYKSLGVPLGRLEPQQGFSLGKTSEITRDELKFTKFVQRLRNKFAGLFDDLMRTQLVLKKVCTEEEWKQFKEQIWYDFRKDNNFSELKEAELLTNRILLLQYVDPFVGRYYSMEWVRKNVLQQTDEDIEEINAQISQEQQAMAPAVDQNGQPIDGQQDQQQSMQQMAAAGGNPPQQQIAQAPDANANVSEDQQQMPSKFELRANELEFLR